MSTIFVTGGSRGIGFELVKQYASIKGNTVIATTRNIEKSVPLTDLAKELGNIKVLALEISSPESIDELEKALPEAVPNGIDIFIANAAIAEPFASILNTPRDIYQRHYDTNVLGSIFVTKVIQPYLLKKLTRKIIFISSVAGKITEYYNGLANSAYGLSKASLNYTAKALSFELSGEGFIVIPIHPGLVLTDALYEVIETASESRKEFLLKNGITPEASASGIIKVVDGLTKEQSGKFYDNNGVELTY